MGYNDITGTISQSYFGGGVSPGDSEAYDVGGIVGGNGGTITASYTAPGATVTGDNDVGGIAGYNIGLIQDSYNSGSVTGRSNYSEGDGGQNVGGISGENSPGGDDGSSPGIIQTSYNTGTVDGLRAVGGIVGYNDYGGTVNTCYNVGTIGDSSTIYVGGIVGDNYGSVNATYNSGLVQGNSDSGTVAAIVGFDEDFATTQNSYWDTSTSGQSIPTNFNSDDEDSASESNLATITSSGESPTPMPSRATITETGNDGDGAGYSYFGLVVGGFRHEWRLRDRRLARQWRRPGLVHHRGPDAADAGHGSDPGNRQSARAPAHGGEPERYLLYNECLRRECHQRSQQRGGGLDHRRLRSHRHQPGRRGLQTASLRRIPNDPGALHQPAQHEQRGSVRLCGHRGDDRRRHPERQRDHGDNGVGGLVGTNYGTLYYDENLNDFTPGLITAEGSEVGGLVGDNFGSITFGENFSDNGGLTVTGAGQRHRGHRRFERGRRRRGRGHEQRRHRRVDRRERRRRIVGTNHGTVTQSINTGNVGSGIEADVGGLVGENFGQVDNSYSGGGYNSGTIDGANNVGGLVGSNQAGGVVETSYNTSTVEGVDSETTGAVVGANANVVQHVYWEWGNGDENESAQPGIGANSDPAGTVDVRGFTAAQLTDANNFAQGSAPTMWDFSPQTGEGGGIWGINVYTYMGEGGGLVTNGLPVLQWQTPVTAEVTGASGTQPYGYVPYTVTGEGASQFSTYVPNPVVTQTGGSDAGDTQTTTISGTPNNYGYNVEYVSGTANIVPDQITITGTSYTIAEGSTTPDFTAIYSGFQPGHDPSDPQLSGELEFTVDPSPSTSVGLHNIEVSGVTSPSGDYVITYIPGVLNVTSSTPTPTQQLRTFQTELGNIQNALGRDPTAGLDPYFFILLPNEVGLGGRRGWRAQR